jgi:hypothetical protein
MVSTASDYVRLSLILLNCDKLQLHVLSPSIVAVMTSDHLSPDIAYSSEAFQSFEPYGIVPIKIFLLVIAAP